MKSIVTEDPLESGTGSRCKGPGDFVVQDLFCWQSSQGGM